MSVYPDIKGDTLILPFYNCRRWDYREIMYHCWRFFVAPMQKQDNRNLYHYYWGKLFFTEFLIKLNEMPIFV